MSTERKLPKYITVDGIRMPGGFYAPAVRDMIHYKPQSDDIFLVTYPKCGTNWMHYICFLIMNKGEPPKSGTEFYSSSPFPELFGIENIATMSRPGIIKTHLPLHLHLYSPEARYIFVVRNPKDCCVSFYHHTETSCALYEFEGGDFNDYFELFLKGEVDYGDYFDHVMAWHKHRNDPNMLWLTYEEMKADTPGVILKVARFLGDEYGKVLESDPNLLQKIVEYSNAKNMKAVTNEFTKGMAKYTDLSKVNAATRHVLGKMINYKGENSTFFQVVRKGIVGDWRNVMNPEQIKRLDEKTEQKMGETELLKYWKQIGAV